MKIAWVHGVKPVINLYGRGIKLSSDPVNFFWEIREAQGFARLGHKVYLVDGWPFDHKVDAVFCAADRQGGVAWAIAKEQNVPFIYQQISSTPDYDDTVWNQIKQYMMCANAITCVSPVVEKGVRKWADKSQYPGSIEIVPHGVDEEIAALIAKMKRDKFVYVGVLMKHKQVDLLIRAAACTGYPLTIVGDGPEKVPLETLARMYNAPVTFLGNVEEREKFKLIKSAKALVHASIGEQFWIPGAEALACDTRIICHRLQDIVDTYKDSLIYFDDFDDLCNIMKYVWEMPDTFGGQVWLEHLGLSLDQRSKKLEKIIKEAVDKYGK